MEGNQKGLSRRSNHAAWNPSPQRKEDQKRLQTSSRNTDPVEANSPNWVHSWTDQHRTGLHPPSYFMLLRKPLAHRTLEELTREVSLCVVLCSLNSSFGHKRLQEVNLQSAMGQLLSHQIQYQEPLQLQAVLQLLQPAMQHKSPLLVKRRPRRASRLHTEILSIKKATTRIACY